MPKKPPRIPAGVLYDECDRDIVEPFFWGIMSRGYVWRRTGGEQILLHRAIMLPADSEHVDHINGDKLDNRRGNLRNVSRFENQANRTKANALNTSGYRGVYRTPRYKHAWMAAVQIHGKQKLLGRSDDPLFLAALASTYRTLCVEGAIS
jgi:hypothetical protein